MNTVVPCTVTGKKDVNKYKEKEMVLPALVSSTQ